MSDTRDKIQLDKKIFKICQAISEEMNMPSYVVGGWVRDQILGRDSKDVDIMVVGNGLEFAKKVAGKLSDKIDVHYFPNFGTAQIKSDDLEYEFVGARKESYRKNSRKPIVESGTFEDDISRRDFTINAISISLNPSDYGKLIDLYDGLGHMEEKLIKTPLDPIQTFSDDPLRMLRAIRFASQLNFHIAPDTLAAIQSESERIQIISQERIHSELNKILLSPNPSIGLNLLFDTGLLDYILPELKLLHGVEYNNGKSHKDNFYHTLQVVDNVAKKSDNLWLRWAALLHDIAKPQTKRYSKTNGWSFHGHEVVGTKMATTIFKRLKLPLDAPLTYVKKLIFLHLRPIALTKEGITDSAVRRLLYEAGEDIDDLMTLCRADITSKNESKVQRYLTNLDKLQNKLVEVEERDHVKNFQPPVDGQFIMDTFHLKPSRIVGIIKSNIKDAILDGKIKNDRDEAIQYMHQIAPELIANYE